MLPRACMASTVWPRSRRSSTCNVTGPPSHFPASTDRCRRPASNTSAPARSSMGASPDAHCNRALSSTATTRALVVPASGTAMLKSSRAAPSRVATRGAYSSSDGCDRSHAVASSRRVVTCPTTRTPPAPVECHSAAALASWNGPACPESMLALTNDPRHSTRACTPVASGQASSPDRLASLSVSAPENEPLSLP